MQIKAFFQLKFRNLFEQNSTAEMNHSEKIADPIFVDATVHVINATNFASSVEIRGFEGLRGLKPRSYSFICTQNDAKELSQQRPLIEFGKREPDDILIQYRNEYSNNGRLSMHFNDTDIKLTYILVHVSVRTCHFTPLKSLKMLTKCLRLIFFIFIILLVTVGCCFHQ